MTSSPSSAAAPSPDRPDLGRLRIDRSAHDTPLRRGVPWIRILLLLLAAAAAALYFREPLGLGTPVRAPLATVRATLVVPGEAQAGDVAANGYVIANRQASLATVISGRLVELNVGVGDSVRENQVVARIQFEDLAAQVQEAERRAEAQQTQIQEAKFRVEAADARVAEARAEHAAARANGANLKAEIDVRRGLLAQAQAVYERAVREVEANRALHERKVLDDDRFDALQTEARVAKRAVDTASKRIAAAEGLVTAWQARVARLLEAVTSAEREAAVQGAGVKRVVAEHAAALQTVEVARLLLDKTYIRAPFDGVVIRKDAEVGEVIASMGAGNSRGSVVTVIDPTSLEMQVELNERRFMGIEAGRPASIFLDADPRRAWPGSVRKVWPGADRSKGTIELRVAFTDVPPYARPDMAGRVVLRTTDKAPVVEEAYVTVPRRTIVNKGGAAFVWVVEGGVLARSDVVLGETKGTAVVVQGLQGNEVLVSRPTDALREGEAVTVQGAK